MQDTETIKMKVRHIKKRALKMMRSFLKRHWKLNSSFKTITQQGLGVEAFAEKFLQDHHNFMLNMHKN